MTQRETDLHSVRRPIDSANGLSNAHYIDPTVYEEERQALLFDQWAGLAVTADVPEPGDAVPVNFMGMPLLLVRDRQKAVRVFQNTCRHRGMILVDAFSFGSCMHSNTTWDKRQPSSAAIRSHNFPGGECPWRCLYRRCKREPDSLQCGPVSKCIYSRRFRRPRIVGRDRFLER